MENNSSNPWQFKEHSSGNYEVTFAGRFFGYISPLVDIESFLGQLFEYGIPVDISTPEELSTPPNN